MNEHGSGRRTHRLILTAVFFTALAGWTRAESSTMAPAPAGVVESGAPSFVVIAPEAIGLSAPPSDLQLMPDCRVVLAAHRELAFGDGVRWETFEADPKIPFELSSLAVDRDGTLFSGVKGEIARIKLGSDQIWRTATALPLPQTSNFRDSTMKEVSAIGDNWYWYGGSGAILSWRPNQQPHLVGDNVSSIETIFALGKRLFVSEQSSGGLAEVSPDGSSTLWRSPRMDIASDTITAVVPFDDRHVLVGTNMAGLKLFDGRQLTPFPGRDVLGSGHRIADLCQAGPLFAAAVNAFGVVFFDRTGAVVQVLDRSLDHRLGRIKRLKYSSNGVVWALLDEGVARINFPAAASRFEPIVGSGMVYVRPLRHQGQLWLMADGRAWRGVYNRDQRLERFDADSPPGRYLFTLADVGGTLFGSTDAGIYVYEDASWHQALAGIVNARIVRKLDDSHWLYAARGEYGTIERTAAGFSAQRIHRADLRDNYNAVTDGHGITWLELGTSRVGRLDPNNGTPTLRILGPESGLSDGWVELFVLDGEVRLHLPNAIFHFDPAQGRFVIDTALLAKYPQLVSVIGRPIRDTHGNLIYTTYGHVNILPDGAGTAKPRQVAVGFEPTEYYVQPDDVIWAFANGRLARIDLKMPSPAVAPLHALITSIQLPESNRRFYGLEPKLGSLAYEDNSVILHFAAPANPFNSAATFEVWLQGAGAQWTSVGTTGIANFSRLKEGHYVFHVRPVVGQERGREDTLAFDVLPPWYRSRLAWVAYVLSAVALIAAAAWFSAYLQRREKVRLERVVAERTRELNRANVQLSRQIDETTEKSRALAASEENFRTLNAELERRVKERTEELATTYRNLVESSRMAGMAEVATGVLHNVGNILNSLNVSCTLLGNRVRNSPTARLGRLSALLDKPADTLAEFLTQDPKGKLVPQYLASLTTHSAAETAWLNEEIESMQKNIDHIKEIVVMQQALATVAGVVETLDAATLVSDALRMNSRVLAKHNIRVVRELDATAAIVVEKGKVLQILTNLIRNAMHACDDANTTEKVMTLRTEISPANTIRIIVSDNGVGILPENLTRIFRLGFTTRAYGHGFGLHSSILAAKEMKGSLSAMSDGPGCGATFVLELPIGQLALPDQPAASFATLNAS